MAIDLTTFEHGEPTYYARREQLIDVVNAINDNETVDQGYAIKAQINAFTAGQRVTGDVQVTGSVSISGDLRVTGSVYSSTGFVGDGSGLTNTGVATDSHAALTNLAYATAAHTGFESSANAQFVSGNLVTRIINSTGSLTRDHAGLTNLAYASSAHTGFAGTAVVNQFTTGQQFQSDVQVTGSLLVRGAVYATSGYNVPRSLTITGITGSMGITWFRTPVALTITEAAYTTRGVGITPSVTASVYCGTSLASGTLIDQRVVTTVGVPEMVRSFTSSTLASGSLVWLDVTGSVNGAAGQSMHLTCDLYF